jgi:hypothetical protein
MIEQDYTATSQKDVTLILPVRNPRKIFGLETDNIKTLLMCGMPGNWRVSDPILNYDKFYSPRTVVTGLNPAGGIND